MSTHKNILLAALTFCLIRSSFAGQNFPFNPTTGEVTYTQTFKLSPSQTSDEAYDIIVSWFGNSAKFTRQNMAAPNESSQSKNKLAVNEAFNNKRPLQSLDPYSKRIAAKGLVKYYGGGNSVIDLMYIEYSMIIEVGEHDVIMTISNIKYRHFNSRSYAMRPIYMWQGGKPLDEVGPISNMAHDNTNTDLNNMKSFLGADMAKIFTDFGRSLNTFPARETALQHN